MRVKLFLSLFALYTVLYFLLLMGFHLISGVDYLNFYLAALIAGQGIAVLTMNRSTVFEAYFAFMRKELEDDKYKIPVIATMIIFFIAFHLVQTRFEYSERLFGDILSFSAISSVSYYVSLYLFKPKES